jgi:hypothetical protein
MFAGERRGAAAHRDFKQWSAHLSKEKYFKKLNADF